ncbi:MAG: SH3 domain-containing protein [Clostridia bacterium]|nr:SH3 domain-containing protein [Clostridia bacterium]
MMINKMMRKGLAGLIILMMLFTAVVPLSAGGEENPDSMAAKVSTEKGALKLRKTAGPKGKVIGEIPNGTCILVTKEAEDWCEVSWNGQTGYCKTEFLILYRGADLSLLDYRVLRDGDKGDDVIALKKRLQELGYIRSGATLTNRYTQETAQRVILFQRQAGMTEDGVAWQELQAYLFSDKAPACSQTLPRIRTKVADKSSRMICGCCMGDGCECCNFTGWVYN